MKKIMCAVCAAVFAVFTVSAQVLPASGVENTLWTGFGNPIDSDTFRYHGLIDTLQARVDIGMFTVDGMINWGALANWNSDNTLDNLYIANTRQSALGCHYYGIWNGTKTYRNGSTTCSNGNTSWYTTLQDSYYVNMLMHPVKGLDAGIGTQLNWKIGPAPAYGAWVWEADSHISQGGFSTKYDDSIYANGSYVVVRNYVYTPDAPGSMDVVGFVPYANKYAKTAIGVRYMNDILEVGGAVPSGANTDNPLLNLGFALKPIDFFRVCAAYEGLFQQDGNLYTGVTFNFTKNFILDCYFAWDSIDSRDNDKDMGYGTGAGLLIVFPSASISIRPEGGINFFEEPLYTPAWYAGISFRWDITDQFMFGAWSSFAAGSLNTNWHDSGYAYYDTTKNWDGGTVFDLRPMFTFRINERHSLSADFDFESRKAFDQTVRNCWSSGLYWTYRYGQGKK